MKEVLLRSFWKSVKDRLLMNAGHGRLRSRMVATVCFTSIVVLVGELVLTALPTNFIGETSPLGLMSVTHATTLVV